MASNRDSPAQPLCDGCRYIEGSQFICWRRTAPITRPLGTLSQKTGIEEFAERGCAA